jgi:hypothetical protein
MHARHNRMMWVGVGGVVLFAAVAGVVFVRSGSSHTRISDRPSPNSTVGVAPLTPTEASALSAELATGTDVALRRAVAVPSGQPIDPKAAIRLRAMGPIAFDVSTFRALGSTDATVRGSLTHPLAGQSARWTFTLSLTSGTWKLVSAEPLR